MGGTVNEDRPPEGRQGTVPGLSWVNTQYAQGGAVLIILTLFVWMVMFYGPRVQEQTAEKFDTLASRQAAVNESLGRTQDAVVRNQTTIMESLRELRQDNREYLTILREILIEIKAIHRDNARKGRDPGGALLPWPWLPLPPLLLAEGVCRAGQVALAGADANRPGGHGPPEYRVDLFGGAARPGAAPPAAGRADGGGLGRLALP